jgi:AcrR family transcriptional regulator
VTASGSEELDPRVVRTRQAVRAAARQVLRSEGVEAVTHQRVSQVAGVGRASVYRHWPDRTQLVIDALTGAARDLEAWRSSGDLATDLSAELGRLQAILNDSPYVADIVALIGRAEWDAALRELKARLLAQGTGGVRRALEAAAARGDLAAGTGLDDAVATLAGPLFYQRVLADRPITDAFVAGVVKGFVRACASAPRRAATD